MDVNFHPASRGAAATGIALGASGLGAALLNGGLAGIFGGARGCSEAIPVSRYEASQSARIAELETEVKLRDANIYTDQKMADFYRYVDGKFSCIESQIGQQAVYNATNTATIGCLSSQVNALLALTKTVIPAVNICPEPMAAPTATT